MPIPVHEGICFSKRQDKDIGVRNGTRNALNRTFRAGKLAWFIHDVEGIGCEVNQGQVEQGETKRIKRVYIDTFYK
jgi:hypothetical protein